MVRAQALDSLVCVVLGFFFFQAEDGIRDVAVTGVQTCALPISCCALRWRDFLRDKESLIRPDSMPSAKITYYKPTVPGNGCSGLTQIGHEVRKIGRASCRERV